MTENQLNSNIRLNRISNTAGGVEIFIASLVANSFVYVPGHIAGGADIIDDVSRRLQSVLDVMIYGNIREEVNELKAIIKRTLTGACPDIRLEPVYKKLDDLSAALTVDKLNAGDADYIGTLESIRKEAVKWVAESEVLHSKESNDALTLACMAFEAGRNYGVIEKRMTTDTADKAQ